MNTKLKKIIAITLGTVLFVSWTGLAQALQTLDSYSESNQNATSTIFADNPELAQSFTASASTNLDSAKFYLSKTGSPTGNITAKLYTHSGTYGASSVPTGAALATSDAVDISTLTTSLALVTFTFSGAERYALTSGTNYIIAVVYSGGDEVSNYLNVGSDNSSPTHSGNLSTFIGIWFAVGNSDAIFYVYGEDATPITNNKTVGINNGVIKINNGTLDL